MSYSSFTDIAIDLEEQRVINSKTAAKLKALDTLFSGVNDYVTAQNYNTNQLITLMMCIAALNGFPV